MDVVRGNVSEAAFDITGHDARTAENYGDNHLGDDIVETPLR